MRRRLATWTIDTIVPAVFPRINPIFRRILKSRLHWLLSWYVVMIYVPGKRTGRIYEVPVAFHRDGPGALESLTSPQGQWWKNLRGLSSVTVVYRGQTRTVRAELVEHNNEMKQRALSRRDVCRRILTPLPPEQSVLIRIVLPDR